MQIQIEPCVVKSVKGRCGSLWDQKGSLFRIMIFLHELSKQLNDR